MATFNVWNDRDLGIDPTAVKSFDEVSDLDVEYYCNYICPFIQLVNAKAVFTEELPLNFVTTSTGEKIHDYGEAISVSVFRKHILDQVKITEEVAKIIATKGWSSVEIIAGTSAMKRFLWIESRRCKFDLAGYVPSASDERYYGLLAAHAKDMGIVWERPLMKPTPQDDIGTAK